MGGDDTQAKRGRCALLIILLTASAASQAELYRFDTGTFLGESSQLPDWADMLSRRAAELPDFHNCIAHEDQCQSRYKGVRKLLERARSLPLEQQLSLINHYVNKRRYREDHTEKLVTALSDAPVKYRSRWSTPGEFFSHGGDCEDFATTKYFLLRELGVDSTRLRIVVTWDRKARGYHAILAVDQVADAVWLLESDNRIHKRRHQNYRYIYAVNENAVWDHETPANADLVTDRTANTNPMETSL